MRKQMKRCYRTICSLKFDYRQLKAVRKHNLTKLTYAAALTLEIVTTDKSPSFRMNSSRN